MEKDQGNDCSQAWQESGEDWTSPHPLHLKVQDSVVILLCFLYKVEKIGY